MAQRPPTLLIAAMATLFLTTAGGVVANHWFPGAVVAAVGTGVLFIGLAVWVVFRKPRSRANGWQAEHHRRDFACPSCGYSRDGLGSNVCPECGYTLAPDAR